MAVTINHQQAKTILQKALHARLSPPGDLVEMLKKVILGEHKTYRYILLTSLLAKATTEKANALSLQAKAPINGAFDARSLCHKVLVPFERDSLVNALGASNEPFLNKPARFTHLSKDNAVRAGYDKEILETLIQIANSVNHGGSPLAFKCLSCCFTLLEKVIANNEMLKTVHTKITPDLIDIYTYITRFIEVSLEGETCAAVVGAVEKQFYACLKGNYRVEVHKVNQCGKSSKEIGDVDVFEDKTCFYSLEVKDKIFTVYDVEHAFNKMIEAHLNRGAFIYGPRATFDEREVKITLYSFEQKKFVSLFMPILEYVRIVLFQTPHVETKNFLQTLLDVTHEMVAKDATIQRVHDLAEEMF